MDDRTSFGFRAVHAAEKRQLVRGVFSSVASRYDLMNDLMSAGVHRLWKSAFVTRANPQPGETYIDIAGGTGDIAASLAARADNRPYTDNKPAASVVLCDINADMLEAARGRASDRIARVCGDAERLPFPDRVADAATIAFGLRNVADMAAALREARRVLKVGGRFLCLEFSHPATAGLQRLYDAYSFTVIPRLGRWVAGDADSYRYLVESIRRFPTQDALAKRFEEAGFRRVRYENLSGGIVAIHSGWKV
jgi:demethylmenaquinone methyltransferase/2-methoxy-6-polyprenyl-1,4-benzoquinol methylase